jgi:hypothetical protein
VSSRAGLTGPSYNFTGLSPSSALYYCSIVTDDTGASAASSSVQLTISSFSFWITPTSGPVGTTVTLHGYGFNIGEEYNYCFESGVTSASAATPCSSVLQFKTEPTGDIPVFSTVTPSGSTGLVVVTDSSGSIVATAEFTVIPSTVPSAIVLTPDSGVTGTPVTITGSGFTPGATVAIAYTNGTVATSPSVVVVTANGTFTAVFNIPSSLPGNNTVSATASNSGGSASMTFAATNVMNYQYTSVKMPLNGTVTVDQTATTGVKVTINATAGTSGVVLVNALTTVPSYSVVPSSFATTNYYDVYVAGTLPTNATALICFTNSAVTPSSLMEYWNGTAWVTVDSTVSGTTICNTGTGSGVIYLSMLTRTNFLISSGLISNPYFIWLFFIGLVSVFSTSFFLIAWSRRRREEEEERSVGPENPT